MLGGFVQYNLFVNSTKRECHGKVRMIVYYGWYYQKYNMKRMVSQISQWKNAWRIWDSMIRRLIVTSNIALQNIFLFFPFAVCSVPFCESHRGILPRFIGRILLVWLRRFRRRCVQPKNHWGTYHWVVSGWNAINVLNTCIDIFLRFAFNYLSFCNLSFEYNLSFCNCFVVFYY